MTRKLIIVILLFILRLPHAYAQQSEIECKVLRRSGAYITLSPAHFDESILPKTGDKVHLLLLVKADLPEGKNEGYYELFTMSVIKISAESKSISFKCDEDMDAARMKNGIPDLYLNSESIVKITW